MKKTYVVIEWDDTKCDINGWLCASGFINHYCGGGARMHPNIAKKK